METQIFKDYEEFLKREDKKINGVSPVFAEAYPDYEKMNLTNEGCWNCKRCWSCEYCKDCEVCDCCFDCKYCKYCEYCEVCKNCEDCLKCWNCEGFIDREYLQYLELRKNPYK